MRWKLGPSRFPSFPARAAPKCQLAGFDDVNRPFWLRTQRANSSDGAELGLA